jgi:hypothetical protein
MIPQNVFVGEKEATLITLYWSPSRHFCTWCRIWIRVYTVEVGAGPVKSKRRVKKYATHRFFDPILILWCGSGTSLSLWCGSGSYFDTLMRIRNQLITLMRFRILFWYFDADPYICYKFRNWSWNLKWEKYGTTWERISSFLRDSRSSCMCHMTGQCRTGNEVLCRLHVSWKIQSNIKNSFWQCCGSGDPESVMKKTGSGTNNPDHTFEGLETISLA